MSWSLVEWVRVIDPCQNWFSGLQCHPNFWRIFGNRLLVMRHISISMILKQNFKKGAHSFISKMQKNLTLAKHVWKTCLSDFFDAKRLIKKEFSCCTEFGRSVLHWSSPHLKDWVRHVCPDMRDYWVVHHDDTPTHTSMVAAEVFVI